MCGCQHVVSYRLCYIFLRSEHSVSQTTCRCGQEDPITYTFLKFLFLRKYLFVLMIILTLCAVCLLHWLDEVSVLFLFHRWYCLGTFAILQEMIHQVGLVVCFISRVSESLLNAMVGKDQPSLLISSIPVNTLWCDYMVIMMEGGSCIFPKLLRGLKEKYCRSTAQIYFTPQANPLIPAI